MRSHLDAEIARGVGAGAASLADDEDDDDDCAADVVLGAAGATAAGTCSRDRLRKAGTTCCAAGEREDEGIEAARLARGVAAADAGNCSEAEAEAAEEADAVGVLAKKAPPPGDGVSGAKKSCKRAG